MRATFLLLAAAALGAACAAPHERAGCGASTDCPAGEYCARTPDGSVCWPDAVPPVVSGVTVTCPTPCLRDSVLQVQATISDDAEVLDAKVELSVGGPPVPMARSGAVWVANIPMASFPFDAFEAEVLATVTAQDGARNERAVSSSSIHVTRLRWKYDAGAPITAPAVMTDGSVVLGSSKSSLQVLCVAPDGTKKWELSTGAKFITVPPTIGDHAIWVADDRYVFGIDPTVLATTPSVGVLMDGTIRGSLATLPDTAKEWAMVGSQSGRVGAASTVASEYSRSGLGDTCTTGPVVGADGRIYVATATVTSTANVRSLAFDGAFTPKWSASVGVNVTAPLAIGANGVIWSGSQDAKLTKTIPSDLAGDPITVATLTGSVVDSPVILESGDVVVGDQSGTLHCFSNSGTRRWAVEPNLEAPPLAPLVLTGSEAVLVVPTKAGRLYAIRGDGTVAWFGDLDGTELSAGNIYAPAGTQDQGLSTAFFSGTNGTLYAVIVDGKLDTAAPWPKAFHDSRNTNRAGAPLP
jgi:hypothetical protein